MRLATPFLLAATVAGAGELPTKAADHVVDAARAPLRDSDIVIGAVVGGVARAYPVIHLWYPDGHVVNDSLAKTPIAASWCPLALSGAIYSRERAGKVLELGAMAEPDQGVLQLYDRATHERFNQVSGRAIGPTPPGEALRRLPSLLTTWGRWKALHPDTSLYVQDPPPSPPAHFNEELLARVVLTSEGPVRDRDWVVGLKGTSGTAAFLTRHLAENRTANESFEGRPILFFLTEDLTTAVAWERTVDGRTLTFTAEGDRVKDAETGSTWEPMTGRAVAGPLSGRSLVRVASTTAIWHAWKTQFPDSKVFGEPNRP